MIINHFLDNDLYKFTTMNAILKKFPLAVVKYNFIARGGIEFPDGFAARLRSEIDHMATIKLTEPEEEFIKRKCYYFDPVFIDILKGYSYNPGEVVVNQDGGKLSVVIEGPWYRTVLWEVPVMAIISELFYIMTGQQPDNYQKRVVEKANEFVKMGAELSEFGTRRRFSYEVQNRVIGLLKENMCGLLNGTSNVCLAMKYDLTPIGTHPHEWFMYHAAHFGYRMGTSVALDNWVDVYHGYLGIALSDTFTSDDFFRSFDVKFSKLFDGVRWDSGDPLEFTDKVLAHYKAHRIDPSTKTVVYSDALDLEKVKEIKEYVAGRIHDVYGIGTYLTNDVGVKPLNMVIKLTDVKPFGNRAYIPAVKLSDVNGKHTGDPEEIDLCMRMLKLK